MSETEETFSLTGILVVSAHLIGLSGLGMLVFLSRISPWYLVDSIVLSLVIQRCVVLLLVFCSSLLFLPVPHLRPHCWNSHYVRAQAIDLSYFFYTTLTPTEVT